MGLADFCNFWDGEFLGFGCGKGERLGRGLEPRHSGSKGLEREVKRKAGTGISDLFGNSSNASEAEKGQKEWA